MVKKVVLIIFLMGTIFMCVFCVPQNIVLTGYSSQSVPHSVVIESLYKPIWYDCMESKSGSGAVVFSKNHVDATRLTIQMSALAITCGVVYAVFRKKQN